MRLAVYPFFIVLAVLFVQTSKAQQKHDIIDRKDYNQSFYIKFKISRGASFWRSTFPENWQDTSGTLNLPAQNRLVFKEDGTERRIGFSALFTMRWGKIGGGFESSRMLVDSLREEVEGNLYKLSYADSNQRVGFNQFFLEYESNPIFLSPKKDMSLIINASAGTFVLSPSAGDLGINLSLFGSIGPQFEVEADRWLLFGLSAHYEFRYFNQKEQFFTKKWVFNNYLHGYNIGIYVKFRFYSENNKREKPPAERVE